MRWLALAAFLAACAPREAPRPKLTVYCSAQLEWCELMVKSYEAHAGVKVAMTRKSAGETLAQITAERKNPRGDVWFGGTGDAHVQAAELRLLEPYRSPRVDELHPWAVDPVGQGRHQTTGLYLGALGYAYGRAWHQKVGAPPLRTWADLLRPELKGEIQLANPNSSGTAYTLMATLVQLFDEDPAFDWMRRLDGSVNQYTLSGAAPVRAAARGETGVGIAFLHDAITEVEAGAPLEVVIPEDGTGYEVGCVSMLRGARHPEAARAFVDWALTPEAQELGEAGRSLQWPSHRAARVPAKAPPLDGVKLLRVDLARFGKRAERARLLARWERDVHAHGD